MKKSSYQGLQKKIRQIQTPKVETFANQYADRDYEIRIDIPEFTCICPKTGLPDFATITIRYVADKGCLELKSLKFYMLFYRDVGIFHENAVNRMLDDLVAASRPRRMEIVGEFNARGGIKTTVKAEYQRP